MISVIKLELQTTLKMPGSSGYGPGIITTVWIGFDDYRQNLGRSTNSGVISDQISGIESGAKSVQPIWDEYMKVTLESISEEK